MSLLNEADAKQKQADKKTDADTALLITAACIIGAIIGLQAIVS